MFVQWDFMGYARIELACLAILTVMDVALTVDVRTVSTALESP
jgi:hypothetical protein